MINKDITYQKYQALRNAVCTTFNINLKELESTSRKANIVAGKRMFFYFLRKHYFLPYMKIADVFDMNHATIIHHCRTMKGYLEYDKETMINYIRVRDLVFEQNSFVTLKDELVILEEEALIINDRIERIKTEINYLTELENGN